jgi:hypothetical protein
MKTKIGNGNLYRSAARNSPPPIERTDSPWSQEEVTVIKVEWVFQLFTPERPCHVAAIKVEFLGYDDWAIRPAPAFLTYDEEGRMGALQYRYHIDTERTDESIEIE